MNEEAIKEKLSKEKEPIYRFNNYNPDTLYKCDPREYCVHDGMVWMCMQNSTGVIPVEGDIWKSLVEHKIYYLLSESERKKVHIKARE